MAEDEQDFGAMTAAQLAELLANGPGQQTLDIESLLSGLDTVAQTGGPPPDILGGFFQTATTQGAPLTGYAAPAQGPFRVEGALEDAYVEGDQYNLLRAMAPENLVRLQDALVATGLASKVIPGQFDSNTLSGFARLLAMSNAKGTQWDTTLAQIEQGVASGLIDPGTSAQNAAALLPDYATVSRQVKSYFRDQLGREPTQAELRLFGDTMMQDAAAAVSADAPDIDLSGATGAGRDVQGQVGHQVDAVARFQEAFDQRYAPDKQSFEEQDATRTGAALGRANIAAAADLAGA